MRLILLLSAVAYAWSAEDPWAKIVSLKSGSELRIYKKGAREPVNATFDQANEERLIIVTKNAQSSVAKEDIDRIDARPFTKAEPKKLTVNSEVKQTDPDQSARPRPGLDVPTTSASNSVTFGGASKPEFETVYRRVAKASGQNPPHPPSPAQ